MVRLGSPALLWLAPAFALLLLSGSGGTPARAQQSGAGEAGGSVGGYRAKLHKWVETRQLISEERSDWEAEAESLRATRDLLREQRAALREEIAELEASRTETDEEQRELLLRRGEQQRASRALEEEIRGLEKRVLTLAPRLPEPLRDKIESLLVQIPRVPAESDTQLGRRLVNVLGVLSQAEKFDGTATLVGETRAVDGDRQGDGEPQGDGERKVQVRTLYWGLGQAYFVAAKGRIAGVGRPGQTDQEALADEAGLLLDIYEGNVDTIRFVRLPVEVR